MKFILAENLTKENIQKELIDELLSKFSAKFFLQTWDDSSMASITIHNMDCTKNYEFVFKNNSLELLLNGKTIKKSSKVSKKTIKSFVNVVYNSIGKTTLI